VVVSETRDQNRVRILIADDSVVSRHLLEAALRKWGYDVESAADGVAAWNILVSEEAPSLAILDWVMPGLTGPEVCRLVRQLHKQKYTYLILLTSKSLKEDLIEGMEAGADDYVTKPFDQHELQVRLRAGLRILELQTELLAAREELIDQASRDSLTKLWNRSTIFDMLQKELSRMERYDSSVGLVMMDIDHFKLINDTYGHLVGDEVLREAARRLRAACRNYDSVGRFGGEEFLIILPGCHTQCIQSHSDRLRASISDDLFLIGNLELRVTASFGATYALPAHGAIPEGLLRTADAALYQAKREGRNCTRISEYDRTAPGGPELNHQLVSQLSSKR
jgi:two-component system cell cycle response regulator